MTPTRKACRAALQRILSRHYCPFCGWKMRVAHFERCRESSIIDTFLEAYDFAGKKLVPFATSGSSGMGERVDNFCKLVAAATVVEGKRLAADISESELDAWTVTL